MQLIIVGLIVIWTTLHTKASDPRLDPAWNSWKVIHNKMYNSTEEEANRRAIWEQKERHINAHNELQATGHLGEQRYTLEHNRFSDWTVGEFKELGGSKPSPAELAQLAYQSGYGSQPVNRTKQVRQGLPASFDWRDRGAVNPVRDQVDCSSCWAFATTAAIEGAHFIRTGQLAVLSEEQFIDCVADDDPRPDRCIDGFFCEAAMRWASTTSGITTDAAYPLVSLATSVLAADAPCRAIADNQLKVRVANAVQVEAGSEDALKEAVATVGPVTVLVNQNIINHMHYSGGTFSDPNCAGTRDDLNHAVLAVGYGTDSFGMDYWILKNSYGVEWGDQGYMFLKRGVNQCGVAMWNWYPTLA